METVKLDIRIEIKTNDVVDTGLTVDQWNALSDVGRSAIAEANWQSLAESDSGGMMVITPGAEDV